MSEPFLAYQLIAIVDHINKATHALIEPILEICPDRLRTEAQEILMQVDMLTENTVERPNLDQLYEGLADLRSKVEHFMRLIPTI